MSGTFTLTGKLLFHDKVTPHEDAPVNLESAAYPDPGDTVVYTQGASTVTDADGSFSFPSLLTESGLWYRVSSGSTPPLFATQTFVAPANGTTVDLSDSLEPYDAGSYTPSAVTQALAAAAAALAAVASVAYSTWQATTAYVSGQTVQAPDGTLIKANSTRTSGASFDTTEQGNWTPVSTKGGTLEQVAQSRTYLAIASRGEAPETFGTVGSGDDTALLMAAHDACVASGGGDVVLRAGRTYVASALTLKSHCGIVGGRGTVLKQKASATNPLVSLYDGSQIDVGLDRLTLDGNKASQSSALDVLHFGDGVTDPGVARHKLSRLRIQNGKGNGLYLASLVRGVTGSDIDIYNCDGYGAVLQGADSKLSNMDVGQSGLVGIYTPGSAYLLTNTKSWFSGRIDGASGGYLIAGDKNVYVAAYSQDNMGDGFQIFKSGTNIHGTQLVGATSENDNSALGTAYGFHLFQSINHIISGVVKTYSGGRNGIPTRAISFDSTSVGEVTLTSEGTSSFAVSGTGGGNTVRFNGRNGTVHAQAWASTITPNPLTAETFATTLTANVTIGNPSIKPTGWLLRYIFTQDATGGRTVAFGTDFLVNWTPNTGASKVNSITFLCDGTHWIQTGSYVAA